MQITVAHPPCTGYYVRHQYEKVTMLYPQKTQPSGGESCNTDMGGSGGGSYWTSRKKVRRRFCRGNSTHKLTVIHMSLRFWATSSSLVSRTHKEVGNNISGAEKTRLESNCTVFGLICDSRESGSRRLEEISLDS